MTIITIIPVQCDDDRPVYGGSGRSYLTATYFHADGRIETIGRPGREPEALAQQAIKNGAVGTIKIRRSRHGRRGAVDTAAWIASAAALTASQVKAADDAARKARIERGNEALRRIIAELEAKGLSDNAEPFRAELGTSWAAAYADD